MKTKHTVQILLNIIMAVVTVIIIFPLIWMLSSSLKEQTAS